MFEMESGFVAVAEGCDDICNETNLSHTVIGVFFTVDDAKLACKLRATGVGNPIDGGWDEYKGIWTAGTESGETLYGITTIGEDVE